MVSKRRSTEFVDRFLCGRKLYFMSDDLYRWSREGHRRYFQLADDGIRSWSIIPEMNHVSRCLGIFDGFRNNRRCSLFFKSKGERYDEHELCHNFNIICFLKILFKF